MTDDKKHEDKDRKKIADEELEDVAGGGMGLDRLGTQKSAKPKKKPRADTSSFGQDTNGDVF